MKYTQYNIIIIPLNPNGGKKTMIPSRSFIK